MNRRQAIRTLFNGAVASCVAPLALCAPSFARASEISFRRAETFADAHGASCRVRVQGAAGSGTFVGIDRETGRAWILTNYHVVGKNERARLDFWTNSDCQTVEAAVAWRAYDADRGFDFAFLALDPSSLATIDPPFVELGGPESAPTQNARIISSGCPDGRFAQAWRGRIVGSWERTTALFQPPPVPGQSGSGILETVDGVPTLVGVLTWLIGEQGRDESKGGALPVSKLYEASRRGTPAAAPSASPIPPGAVECKEIFR